MKKAGVIFLVFLCVCHISSQVVYNSSSVIRCNSTRSFVNFAIGGGTLGTTPFSFTLNAPSCTSNTVVSSSSHFRSIPLSCAGVYTISIEDALNQNFGTYTHTVSQDIAINWKLYSTLNADSICLGTAFAIGVADSGKYLFSNVSSNFLSNNPLVPGSLTLVTVTPSITTTYTYSALFTNGTKTCIASDSKSVAVVTSLNGGSLNCFNNLSELDNLFKLWVAPNPIVAKFRVLFDPGKTQISKISITNTLGQQVFILNEPRPDTDIDISFLKSGVYYLVAENTERQKAFKILKE